MIFEGYRFILASQSPRRRELLAGLGIEFTVEKIADGNESYDPSTPHSVIPQMLARRKSECFGRPLEDDEVLITADTLVFCGDEILGKPVDREDAVRMLRMLSGRTHHVRTGVAIRTKGEMRSFTSETEVVFKELSDEEMDFYIDNYRPFDKAGAYGVQEWIGYVGITAIHGSYFNVMGLPVQRLYSELEAFLPRKRQI